MKILVVSQYYYPEPFRITDICEELVRRGHAVTVLTGLPNYPEGTVLEHYRRGKRRSETINGVKVIRCFEVGRGNNKLQLFLNYFSYTISASFKAFFLKEKFDVVLVNQLSPVLMAIPGIVYKFKHKKKILLYCLDLWPASLSAGGVKDNSVIYKLFLIISRWIYNSVDSIAITSSMFREYFNNTLEIVEKDINMLPQYAEDLFAETNEFLRDGNYNFVFAGNIGDMQSVETIIYAANELRTRTDVIFHIIGDGSKLEECKKLTHKLELLNIKFYGRKPLSEMPQFYGLADAMLLTLKDDETISYTLPGKVQSYMAAGKPIIGAINGEANHIIKDSDCGYCCNAEDYKELANLINRFCDSSKKETLGQNAYKYYINNYSKKKFMSVLENTLLDLEDK